MEYPSNVVALQRKLNLNRTWSEKHFASICKRYGAKYQSNVPFQLEGYRTIGWGFADIILFDSIAIELDGQHHRANEGQYNNDIEKRNKLWVQHKIPTIRITNEALQFIKEDTWKSFFIILNDIMGNPKKLRKLRKIYTKYDFYEVMKGFSSLMNNRQRLQNRAHITEFLFSFESFKDYDKYNFKLSNGLYGFTWVSNIGIVPYKIGDYVKYKSEASKPGKFKLEKVFDFVE